MGGGGSYQFIASQLQKAPLVLLAVVPGQLAQGDALPVEDPGGTLQEEGDSLTLSAVLLFPQAAVALAWHAGHRGGSFPAGPSVLHLLPGQHSTWTPLLSSSGPNPQLPKVTHGGSPGAHTAF